MEPQVKMVTCLKKMNATILRYSFVGLETQSKTLAGSLSSEFDRTDVTAGCRLVLSCQWGPSNKPLLIMLMQRVPL